MENFRHVVPALRLHHGSNALQQLRQELTRLNSSRAVIFCGSSLARDSFAIECLQNEIGDLCAGVLPIVRSHSPLPAVQAASDELRRLNADAVIALGGGSAIVMARAASILLAEGCDVRRLCTSRDAHGKLVSPRLNAKKLPQLVIATTPTTAIVKAGSAVLDPVDGSRLALFDPKTRAQAVFVDPYLIGTPDRKLVMSAGLNTLAMAIEGLASLSGDPMSDAYLIHALRILVHELPSVASADSLHARSQLMHAAIMCGHGTDYTGAGIAIPLGHALSARFHLDNGITNAIVLPHVLRFNAGYAKSGLGKIALALGEMPAGAEVNVEHLNARLRAVFDSLGVPTRLRDVGVTKESLTDIASISMGDWFVRDNPRSVHAASELENILQEAW